ncbi:hypothetical protein H9L21_15175 [Aeromicrobium senzhongii]|uniref:Uncharacterized protein n=1 Tax=Aeromicrobium senzhongii TaxID=2663859 RepID=A0ABX6STC6_9ACTN|nr:hypothetical protein [Aeromicrobium senzhongii]MTB89470.1 hypothetical protein [Aeromicrobium senzhongii]QNL94393.1 hypothetical protein H9L21_15175 [Aeromicrobium senzhongii]
MRRQFLRAGVSAAVVVAVLSGCESRSSDEKAIDNATETLRERAAEIIEEAEFVLVDRGLGDKDPTAGMATAFPELVDVPSRDPLTWIFYLHDAGTGGGWMETTSVQVGGCLQIIDDGADLQTTAVRCPKSAPEWRKKHFKVEIDVLTGEPW